MYTIQAKIIGARIGFKLVFLSGFWLSRSGKPSQSGIVTLHKLISLAQVVVLYLVLRQFQQTSSLTTMELIAAVIAGGFFLIMILTG